MGDAFEQVLWLLRQFCVDSEVARPLIAVPPLGLPCRDDGRNRPVQKSLVPRVHGRFALGSVPPGRRTPAIMAVEELAGAGRWPA